MLVRKYMILTNSESESRGAGVMWLNSTLRSRWRASLYPSRDSNENRITDAWPGMYLFFLVNTGFTSKTAAFSDQDVSAQVEDAL